MTRWSRLVLLATACGRVDFDGRLLRDATTIDAPVYSLDAGECPPAYARAGASCYRLDRTNDASWLDAETLCEADALGAHLAVIDDGAAYSDALTVLDVNDAWIGASDRIQTGTYLNVDGSPLYLMWASGQPSELGIEHCVFITVDGMYDSDCPQENDFICEYDGRAPDPGAF